MAIAKKPAVKKKPMMAPAAPAAAGQMPAYKKGSAKSKC